MDRRTALKLLAAGLALAPSSFRTAAAQQAELPWTLLGFSQGGTPLVLKHLGSGPQHVLVLGGQHGGPEANTIALAGSLLEYYTTHPEQIPPNVTLDILEVANPDGAAVGIRQFLSGVDPNRNWGGPEWQADAWDSNGQFRPGLGGAQPFSDQETRALRDWLLANRPVMTINYHSVGGFMFGPWDGLGGALAAAYQEASGYYRPAPSGGGGGGPRLLSYRATGTMNSWQRQHGMDSIFIELSTTWGQEYDRNLAGLQAVLAQLAVA